ncbi:MAG: hypothetical protein IJF65_00545 [Clostridia bacterium]|nr:hypothetical protein [Clostridia bacterium]
MTERLYYDNAYLTEFDARVLACRKKDDAFEVLLDRSAFYPTSGGQPFDTGALNGADVLDVNVIDGEVWHKVSEPLTAGSLVHGVIHWPRRFDHMQQHAADHMIAGTLHRLMGGVTIGLHISEEVSTIDVAMPQGVTRLTPAQIQQIENEVNERIQRDVPIRCWFPDQAELARLPLRKEPTVTEHVRIVAIGDDEMVACGGTHPATAGQLGLVKILSTTPARGKMRLCFVAGMRALRDYQRCYGACHQAAERLSATADTLPAAVESLANRLKAAEAELAKIKKEQLLAQTETFIQQAEPLPGGEKLIARFVEGDVQCLRDLVSRLIETPGCVALLGTMNGDQAAYVFGRSPDVDRDMGALLRASAQPLGGKGGGRPDFAQGGGSPEILQAACQRLRG